MRKSRFQDCVVIITALFHALLKRAIAVTLVNLRARAKHVHRVFLEKLQAVVDCANRRLGVVVGRVFRGGRQFGLLGGAGLTVFDSLDRSLDGALEGPEVQHRIARHLGVDALLRLQLLSVGGGDLVRGMLLGRSQRFRVESPRR